MINDLVARIVKLLTNLVSAVAARLSDPTLERTLGSWPGIRIIFGAMSRDFVPAAADGFEGTIGYELSRQDGAVDRWGMRITPSAAIPSVGYPPDTALTVKLTVVDFVRLSVGAEQPTTLLMGGRLELDGDLMVAAKLGPMFGRPLPEAA